MFLFLQFKDIEQVEFLRVEEMSNSGFVCLLVGYIFVVKLLKYFSF